MIAEDNMGDTRTAYPVCIIVLIKSISVDEDSVRCVGSFRSCLSPYKSEILSKR